MLLVLILTSPFLIVQTVLLILRIGSGDANWDWFLILIPLWVLSALSSIVLVRYSWDHRKRPEKYWFYWLCLAATIAFLVLIAIRLNASDRGDDFASWATVFIPAWVKVSATAVAYSLHRWNYGGWTSGASQTFLYRPLLDVAIYLFLISVLILSILVPVKLDAGGGGFVPWPVVFVPLWVATAVALGVLLAITISRNGGGARWIDPGGGRDTKDGWMDGLASRVPVWVVDVVYYATVGLFLTFFVLLAIELEDPSSVNLLVLFSPLLVAFSSWFLVPYVISKCTTGYVHTEAWERF